MPCLYFGNLILEIALDGLNLVSLNTPSSLGMSLSVIGALLLGEQSIQAGYLYLRQSFNGCYSFMHFPSLALSWHMQIIL